MTKTNKKPFRIVIRNSVHHIVFLDFLGLKNIILKPLWVVGDFFAKAY